MRNKLILAAAFVSMSFASCLKNTDSLGFQNDKGSIVCEIASHNISDPRVVSVEPLPATETLDLMTLAFHAPRANKPSSDIRIKFRLNNTLISTYNSVNGASLLPMPISAYTLDAAGMEVTIPKGSYGEKTVKITVNKSALSLTETYAIGLSIESVSEGVISEIAKDFLFVLGVKNKYDGHYRCNGTMVDFANSTLTGFYPLDWDLVTNGPNQCIVYDRDYTGTPTHIINTPTGLSQYGSFGLIIDFDPAGTGAIVSVKNFYGTPPAYVSSNGRSAELDPSGVNTWNPSTKKVTIKYWMNQPSVITPHRTAFDETWTYIGPR